jgi:hypothetical protein
MLALKATGAAKKIGLTNSFNAHYLVRVAKGRNAYYFDKLCAF